VIDRYERPEWFPLGVYVTAPNSFEHWIRLVAFRLAIINAPQNNKWKIDKYTKLVIEDSGTVWLKPNEKDFFGIKEINPYEAFMLAGLFDSHDSAEAKKLAGKTLTGIYDHSSEASEIRRQQSSECNNENVDLRWADAFRYRVPVLVDLSLDDSLLKKHFDFWLKFQRLAIKERGINAEGTALKDDSLTKWHNFRVLAAYDLQAWREISGAKYSDASIAAWLWPDEGDLADNSSVDRAERYRKVTKPLVETVMSWYMVDRLEKHWSWASLTQAMGDQNRAE
jgi:hypothetical protein